MSKMRRVANIALSLLMVAGGVLLLQGPDEALELVAFILCAWLLVSGARKLVYYFTMARHMVGGLWLLFIAVITTDIGGFGFLLIDEPRLSIALYLVGYNTFAGFIDIVRSIESKKMDSHWVASLLHSVVRFALAIACIAFLGSAQIVTMLFCIGLLYSAAARFASAVRPSEIIYVQ